MLRPLLRKVVSVHDDEIRAVLWSGAHIFCLLAAWYILRPLREEIGAHDRENLSRLWTGTFFGMLLLVPLYSVLMSRYPRRMFIPLLYRFFVVNLLLFYLLLRLLPPDSVIWVERVFYVWASVFNLFVITSFWGFMADLYANEQGKRLFGFIALGGTLGGVAGSLTTAGLAEALGPVNLLILVIVLLEGACQCVRALNRLSHDRAPAAPAAATAATTGQAEEPVRGSLLSGVGAVFRSPYLASICLYLFIFTLGSTFLYFAQTDIVRAAFPDRAERTAVFGSINLWTNAVTAAMQLFATGRIIRRIGIAATLTVLPFITGVGFLALGLAPTLLVLVVFQVARRAGNFALARPAREVLFTVVSREQKYRSKSFIDTVVYRGGDLANAWFYDGLRWIGLGMRAVLFVAVPLSLAGVLIGTWLGHRQEKLALERSLGAGPPE